jgi:hypothetical protein
VNEGNEEGRAGDLYCQRPVTPSHKGKSMNKSDLVDAIAQQTGQTKTATDETSQAFLEVVTDKVAAGDAVQLVGFGTFKPAHRAAA